MGSGLTSRCCPSILNPQIKTVATPGGGDQADNTRDPGNTHRDILHS
jgi:hypothetical protein